MFALLELFVPVVERVERLVGGIKRLVTFFGRAGLLLGSRASDSPQLGEERRPAGD